MLRDGQRCGRAAVRGVNLLLCGAWYLVMDGMGMNADVGADRGQLAHACWAAVAHRNAFEWTCMENDGSSWLRGHRSACGGGWRILLECVAAADAFGARSLVWLAEVFDWSPLGWPSQTMASAAVPCTEQHAATSPPSAHIVPSFAPGVIRGSMLTARHDAAAWLFFGELLCARHQVQLWLRPPDCAVGTGEPLLMTAE